MDTPLWRWSCQLYAIPRVKQRLLALQDDDQLDVNVILACLWSEKEQIVLGAQQLTKLFVWSRQWAENITIQLRQSRRNAKMMLPASNVAAGNNNHNIEDVAALYAQIKQCELNAERIHLDMLYKMISMQVAMGHDPSTPACDMFEMYCRFKKVPFNGLIRTRYEDLRWML